jgi:hypothetical protein
MSIEVRWWDGQGNPDDPKVGTPGVNNHEAYTVLRGKVISGVGGIIAGTESVGFNLPDGLPFLWFTTAGTGTPRILIRRK